MTFWDEYATAEQEHRDAYRLSKETPTKCVKCSIVDRDVLLGYCSPCFALQESHAVATG